jgi:hypothetical protein
MIAGNKLAGSAADPSSNKDPELAELGPGRFCIVASAKDMIFGIDSEGIGSGRGNGLTGWNTERVEYSLSIIHSASVPFSHLVY